MRLSLNFHVFFLFSVSSSSLFRGRHEQAAVGRCWGRPGCQAWRGHGQRARRVPKHGSLPGATEAGVTQGVGTTTGLFLLLT